MEKIPENLVVSYLEVVIMSNGEIISNGKTLGFFEKFKSVLHSKEELKRGLT